MRLTHPPGQHRIRPLPRRLHRAAQIPKRRQHPHHRQPPRINLHRTTLLRRILLRRLRSLPHRHRDDHRASRIRPTIRTPAATATATASPPSSTATTSPPPTTIPISTPARPGGLPSHIQLLALVVHVPGVRAADVQRCAGVVGECGQLGADESRAWAHGGGGDGHGRADDVEWGLEDGGAKGEGEGGGWGGGTGGAEAEGDEC